MIHSEKDLKNRLLGEVWESFYIEGGRVGFSHRQTTIAEQPYLLTTQLDIMLFVQGHVSSRHHTYTFHDTSGYPAHSYLFDTNNGAPVYARFENQEIICQIDEDVFVERVPADASPGYGYYPHVVSMPFQDGFIKTVTRIEDASGTIQGQGEFVSEGWQTMTIRHESIELWQVSEYLNGRRTGRYWLDDQRRIRKSEWLGATSYWEPTQAAALDNLPSALIDYAQTNINQDHNVEWTADIVSFLAEQKTKNND